MDEVDAKQQSEIERLKAHAEVNKAVDAAQASKDEEHDRKLNRMLFAYAIVFGWLGILSLATGLSVFVQNRITVTVEPRGAVRAR